MAGTTHEEQRPVIVDRSGEREDCEHYDECLTLAAKFDAKQVQCPRCLEMRGQA